jgi:hypothetical protein
MSEQTLAEFGDSARCLFRAAFFRALCSAGLAVLTAVASATPFAFNFDEIGGSGWSKGIGAPELPESLVHFQLESLNRSSFTPPAPSMARSQKLRQHHQSLQARTGLRGKTLSMPWVWPCMPVLLVSDNRHKRGRPSNVLTSAWRDCSPRAVSHVSVLFSS